MKAHKRLMAALADLSVDAELRELREVERRWFRMLVHPKHERGPNRRQRRAAEFAAKEVA